MTLRPVPTESIVKPEPVGPPPRPRGTGGTFSALRHPAFRLYFGGQLISFSGSWMQIVAQQVVVYNLTGSELMLGVIACVQGLPALVLAPFAGVLIDRFSKRKLMYGTQTALVIMALLMAVLYATGTLQVWHILILSIAVGAANALDAPTRQAFLVNLVGHEDLPSGIALTSLMFNSARIFGPALGGILLATVGAGWCFFLNGLSFLAVIASLYFMRIRPTENTAAPRSVLSALRAGVRFVRTHQTIGPLLLLASLTSMVGLPFMVLLAPFADKVLHNTEIGTSALLSAQGVGALIASLFIARYGNSRTRGRLLAVGAVIGPLALIALALTSSFLSALPLVGIAGSSFVLQFVLSNTLIQTHVPDEFRGRVMSLYTISVLGLNPLGGLLIGQTAELINPVRALFLFGVIDLIGVLFILRRAPQITRLR